MTHSRTRLILLASTVLVGPAIAQDADVTLLDELRIEAPGAQGLLGNAEITEDEIEARNPASMQDVFVSESAITSSGGAAIGQKVFVNGVEESLLSVTIDGARQNKSAFHHTGNILLDPSLLKSVEVSSGLAPADAGSGAMAGSIAYETKDARDLLEVGETMGGLLTVAAGTNGRDVRGTLSVFGENAGFEYLLSGTRVIGSDYEDGDGVTVPGTEPELSSYLAKLAFTTEEGNRLSFSASQTEDAGMRAAQQNFFGDYFIRPDFFGVVTGPTVLMEGLSRRTSYTLTYADETPGGMFAPTAQIAYNEQKVDVIGTWGVNKSLSGFFKNEFELGNGTVTAGVDFFDESAEGYYNEAVGPDTFMGKESHRGFGLFAQARQDLGDRVSVSYGARFDVQDFTGADGSEFSDNGISLNAAADFILTDTLTLTAGIASTWGGYELGEAALINYNSSWAYAGLTTSRAESARVGLRYENGGWDISGAVFQTHARDLSAILPAFPVYDRAATTDIKTTGFDGSIGYDWGNGMARLNYTYADVTENGDPISGTRYYFGRPMGHIIGLEAAWQATDSLRIGGSGQIAFKHTDVATGEAPLDGYEVFNLYAEFIPSNIDNLKIRLDVDNLFDSTYVARGADISSRAIDLTEPGRTIELTATWRF